MNNQKPNSWIRVILFIVLGTLMAAITRHIIDWTIPIFPQYASEVEKGIAIIFAIVVGFCVLIPMSKEFKPPDKSSKNRDN